MFFYFNKGQTALEYLLVVTISMVVVAVVAVWLSGTTSDIKERSNEANPYICGTTECPDSSDAGVTDAEADAVCRSIEACGLSATCDRDLGLCQIN